MLVASMPKKDDLFMDLSENFRVLFPAVPFLRIHAALGNFTKPEIEVIVKMTFQVIHGPKITFLQQIFLI